MDKQTVNVTNALKAFGVEVDYTLKADSTAYNFLAIAFVLVLALIVINKKL